MDAKIKTGGQLIVDCLRVNDVERIFCVPGESFLPVLDALYDVPDIDLIVCRNEGGAAMMADAHGKLTGRPGICFVTRGPGAANASGGLHIAFQDSNPLILFIGQIERNTTDREAFQEIDYRRMFGQMAKWVAQIDSAERIPEYISHAFHMAMSGRAGPVVLALPQDMLHETAGSTLLEPAHVIEAHPGPEDMQKLSSLIAKAERPVLMLGGSGWDEEACKNIRIFAEDNELPVCVSFRAQDLFDNSHPNYIGELGLGVNPKLVKRVGNADLLVAAGPRLGAMTTGGYQLLSIPKPKQRLVHVHAGAEELGRVYRADLAINSSMRAFARASATLTPIRRNRQSAVRQGHEEYLEWIKPTPAPGHLQFAEVLKWLRENIPPDSIICNGAGNYTSWIHRFYCYRKKGSQLAPTSGSMGYGTPSAVAAKRLYPERTVIAFAGDGCFLMNGQELATAAYYGINIIVIVVNNGIYGTIRMHQERNYPGRTIGSGLEGTDFAALARAYGAHGEVVTETGKFPDAFERALGYGQPALIELRVDPEAITPTATLSGIRSASMR
ncbi:MAG: thiamine pyrophosphate-binding protein [Desulfocapsaceae bacterium]